MEGPFGPGSGDVRRAQIRDVRCSPMSGHAQRPHQCLQGAMTGHFIWYFRLLNDRLLRTESGLGRRPLTKALPILGSL